MPKRIRQLKEASLSHEPDPSQRHHLLAQVTAYGEAFIQALDDTPAFVTYDNRELFVEPINEERVDISDVLSVLKSDLDGPGINNASGRMLLTSTRINGYHVLRPAIVSFRTHLDEIEETLTILKRMPRRIRNI